ncbi:hypothetical protein WILLOW_25 [Paenibacillus phage Willow]|uniref:Uncharacterized protein n=2 Tax=Fernvirus fern TaxID=2845736 RepID=A0A0K2CXV6_9CAUD|nr:hypothetical protein FERN_25 [Paenibacillus phage Fern]YP_009593434.1 hypothetical protein FDG84_gp25 [Paenibacillus phage Willow]ALA12335.1 hypothetical protein FERN_25 [Paenibacillus phage Fern]ALA12405.1 hypothetical protein WILLOW_25 [Paenibacillus phage Willow]
MQNYGFLGEMVANSFCQDLCNVFIDNFMNNQFIPTNYTQFL